jgi:hypothetical protein
LKFILPAASASASASATAYARYGPVVVGGCIAGAAGVAVYLWAKQFYTKE